MSHIESNLWSWFWLAASLAIERPANLERTKNWNNAWLPKARDDQREAMADCVVIVSETLPEGVRSFARIEGVWVCGWLYFAALAKALRFRLFEIGKTRPVIQGQNEKMELV